MRILVVEDEFVIALDLQCTLESAGHNVIGPVATAEKALEIIKDRCPELALVDINLKDGYGAGIEIARALLEQCGVPSLFVSGQIQEARANKDAALGYIGKPWGSKTVLESVNVADCIIRGQNVPAVPKGLELFKEDVLE